MADIGPEAQAATPAAFRKQVGGHRLRDTYRSVDPGKGLMRVRMRPGATDPKTQQSHDLGLPGQWLRCLQRSDGAEMGIAEVIVETGLETCASHQPRGSPARTLPCSLPTMSCGPAQR
jgi:hypothetical protein